MRIAAATLVALVAMQMSGQRSQAPDLRPEITIEGGVDEISLSPSGDLWLTTSLGTAFVSRDRNTTWREVKLPTRPYDLSAGLISTDSVERVSFFDEQRAIATGSIGEGGTTVLKTEDGGRTWDKVEGIEELMQVYDTHTTSDGHAWVVGSNGHLHVSSDFGRTFRHVANVFDHERSMAVFFSSPSEGFVGSLVGGLLSYTKDGGKQWIPFSRANDAAINARCVGPDKRLTRIRVKDGEVFIQKCGGAWVAAISDSSQPWRELTANGSAIHRFDLHGEGLVAVNEASEVHEVRSDGTSKSLGLTLGHPLLDLRTSGERIALIDITKKVSIFDGSSWSSSRLLGDGVGKEWPIHSVDRGTDGALWGVSSFFLYRSDDGGAHWARIAEPPRGVSSFALQRNGNPLLWDAHGWVQRFVVSRGAFEDVPTLSNLDVIGSLRREDVWLLYGGRLSDSAERITIARSLVAGQFAGSVEYGFVAASRDGGASWEIVDRWNDAGPQLAFLSDDDQLTLVSWLGAVRQGILPRKGAAKMKTVVKGDDSNAPYSENTYLIDLLDKKNGWIMGETHYVGLVTHQSRDGGLTWRAAEPHKVFRSWVAPVRKGEWVALLSDGSLQRIIKGKVVPLPSAPGEMSSLTVDSTGRVLFGTKDGKFHSLSEDEAGWVEATVRPRE